MKMQSEFRGEFKFDSRGCGGRKGNEMTDEHEMSLKCVRNESPSLN
jgi:hypothetical protein